MQGEYLNFACRHRAERARRLGCSHLLLPAQNLRSSAFALLLTTATDQIEAAAVLCHRRQPILDSESSASPAQASKIDGRDYGLWESARAARPAEPQRASGNRHGPVSAPPPAS